MRSVFRSNRNSFFRRQHNSIENIPYQQNCIVKETWRRKKDENDTSEEILEMMKKNVDDWIDKFYDELFDPKNYMCGRIIKDIEKSIDSGNTSSIYYITNYYRNPAFWYPGCQLEPNHPLFTYITCAELVDSLYHNRHIYSRKVNIKEHKLNGCNIFIKRINFQILDLFRPIQGVSIVLKRKPE